MNTVTVSAVVPLTDTFTYLIRKNSTVIFEKKAFVLGEEGEIRVSIRGGGGEILRNHHIMGRIFDVRHEEVTSFSGVTDSAGKVMFRVKFTERFLGKNTVQVADMTYGEPLFLMEQPDCIVYEERDAQEKANQDGKQALTNSQMAEMGTLFMYSSPPCSDFLEKSATIARYPSVEAFSRAGPT